MKTEMGAKTLPFLPAHRWKTDTHPALFDDDTPEGISYAELAKRVEETSSLFTASERDLVFCCLPRTIDGVTAYLAVADAGHAIALLNPTHGAVSDLAKAYAPKWIIKTDNDKIDGYKQQKDFPSSLFLFERLTQQSAFIHPDFYLLLLTSGSTGSNKGVRLSYKNVAVNCASIIDSLDLTRRERSLGHLPLSYSFGISVLHTSLATGGSCVLSEHGLMTGKLWALARTTKTTLFPGVPYHYEMLTRLGLDRLNVPSLKTFLQAGGKMNAETTGLMLQETHHRKGRLFVMYGQTEAAPRISCFPLHEFPEKIGSAGRVMKHGHFSIEEDELVYFGPNVMLGYAQCRKDLGLGDTTHGRLATGDFAEVDQDGFLFIIGRKQRFAKIFGNRVALDDIEKIVGKLAKCLALEGKEHICLFTTEKKEELLKQIPTFLGIETRMPPAWFKILPIDEIPYQPSGKIDYATLKAMISS